MKTSFTKWCREKMKNYLVLTLLFTFVTSSGLKAEDFATCVSAIDSIIDISVKLECDASMHVEFPINSANKTDKCYRFVYGTAGQDPGQNFQIIHHTASVWLDHAPKRFDDNNTTEFSIIEYCDCPPHGEMPPSNTTDYNRYIISLPNSVTMGNAHPDWDGGHYDVQAIPSTDYEGILVIDGDPKEVSGPVVTYEAQSPWCPMDSNGVLTVYLGETGEDKCDDYSVDVTISGSVVSGATMTTKSGSGGKIEFENLKAGDFWLTVTQTDRSCPCDFDPVQKHGTIKQPSNQTVSMACINDINVSISGYCKAVIHESSILLGANDPCGMQMMMEIADSIIVRDHHGNFVAGGRDSVVIENADRFSGEYLKIEVHDFHADPNDEDFLGTGNYCWGNLHIEDKTPPQLTCETGADTLWCWELFDELNHAPFTLEEIIDKQILPWECTYPITSTVIAQTTVVNCDEITDINSDIILKEFRATYYATDGAGNQSNSCTDTFKIRRLGYATGGISGFNNNKLGLHGKVLYPPDFVKPEALGGNGPGDDLDALHCEHDIKYDKYGNPAPIAIGKYGTMFPQLMVTGHDGTIDTIPLYPFNYEPYDPIECPIDPYYQAWVTHMLEFCKMGVSYEDLVLPTGTTCTKKLIRTWTIREWSCDGELDTSWQQFIEIIDENGPIFKHPVANTTKTVNTDRCSRIAEIKLPEIGEDVYDECSHDNVKIEVTIFDKEWNLIGPDVGDTYFEFPLDTNYVIYTAFDECHNYTNDTALVIVVDEIKRGGGGVWWQKTF